MTDHSFFVFQPKDVRGPAAADEDEPSDADFAAYDEAVSLYNNDQNPKEGATTLVGVMLTAGATGRSWFDRQWLTGSRTGSDEHDGSLRVVDNARYQCAAARSADAVATRISAPYERSNVDKVVAGVLTGRRPRTSPTIERSERDSARHHPYNAGCGLVESIRRR